MKKDLLLSFVLVTALLLCSCSERKVYQNVLPASAKVVARVDVRSLVEKGDLGNVKVLQALSGKSEWTKEYMDNPASTGLDFTQPAYLFVDGESNVGLVMCVDDADKLGEFFAKIAEKEHTVTKPKEKKGLMGGTFMMICPYVYDESALMVMMGDKGVSQMEAMMRKMMEKNEEDSFVATEAYEKMEMETGDIVAYADLSLFRRLLDGKFESYMLGNVAADDLELLLNVDCQSGKMVAKGHLRGKTAATQQALEAFGDQCSNIEGKYVDLVAENCNMWACGGVKGAWLLEQLKKSNDVKQLLFMVERGMDIEQIIRAVNGDFAVEIGADGWVRGDFSNADVVVRATVENTDFMNEVEEWKQSAAEYGMSLRNNGKDAFVLDMGGETLEWGVRDHDFHMAWNHSNRVAGNGRSLLAERRDEIVGCLSYLFVNLRNNGVANNLQTLTLRLPKVGEFVLEVEAADKEQNILRQIL